MKLEDFLMRYNNSLAYYVISTLNRTMPNHEVLEFVCDYEKAHMTDYVVREPICPSLKERKEYDRYRWAKDNIHKVQQCANPCTNYLRTSPLWVVLEDSEHKLTVDVYENRALFMKNFSWHQQSAFCNVNKACIGLHCKKGGKLYDVVMIVESEGLLPFRVLGTEEESRIMLNPVVIYRRGCFADRSFVRHLKSTQTMRAVNLTEKLVDAAKVCTTNYDLWDIVAGYLNVHEKKWIKHIRQICRPNARKKELDETELPRIEAELQECVIEEYSVFTASGCGQDFYVAYTDFGSHSLRITTTNNQTKPGDFRKQVAGIFSCSEVHTAKDRYYINAVSC